MKLVSSQCAGFFGVGSGLLVPNSWNIAGNSGNVNLDRPGLYLMSVIGIASVKAPTGGGNIHARLVFNALAGFQGVLPQVIAETDNLTFASNEKKIVSLLNQQFLCLPSSFVGGSIAPGLFGVEFDLEPTSSGFSIDAGGGPSGASGLHFRFELLDE